MKRIDYSLIRIFWFLGSFVLIRATKRTTIIPGSKILLSSEEKIDNVISQSCLMNECKCKSLILRGGSDSECDGYDDEDDEDKSSEVLDKAIDLSKQSIALVGKFTRNITIKVYHAIKRAINAGLEGGDVEEDGLASKMINTVTRMIKAVFSFDVDDDEEAEDSGDDDSVEETETSDEEPVVPVKANPDFGSFLSKAYGTKDNRGEEGPLFLGGTLANACEIARSQARILVVFLPSKRPVKGKKAKDDLAIASLLSAEVADAANKRARRKGGDTGSFLFWGAKAGSSEATAGMKRLKTKATSSNGDKRPILAVVYPAKTESAGGYKIVPKVLAQHHCSPPPTGSLMASWLDALRKRHAKQYTSMQTNLKEAKYYKERLVGYSDSVKSDNERKQREKEEEAKRLVEEAAEKERQEAIELRREELKESLPGEDKSPTAKKIALRFADGRSGQRQFSPDQPISDVFNWVDAMYEIEREKVLLTTMNGKRTFIWDEEENATSLKDTGLGRNTGLRVTEKKYELEEEESEKDAEDL